jgi:hypothetical protein
MVKESLMKNVETLDYQFGDKTYTLTALTVGDMTAFRDFLKHKKMADLGESTEGTPEKHAEMLKVASLPITDLEFHAGLNELSSLVFLLFRSLSKRHRKMTLEKAGDLIPVNGVNELFGIVTVIMGGGQNAGNPPKPPEAANQ